MNKNSMNLYQSIIDIRDCKTLLGSLILITFSLSSISDESNPPSSNEPLLIQINQNNTATTLESTQYTQPIVPINLNSDTTTMDGISREIKNCGNARISQGDINLLADCIVAKKGAKGEYEYFEAIGTPASIDIFDRVKKEHLFLSASKIFYEVIKGSFVATGSADLVLSSGQKNEDSPDRLNIQSNQIIIENNLEKQRMIKAKGTPVHLVIRSEGNIELNAKSLYLSYSTKTNELSLLDKVEAELALGKITAGEFRYNHRTKQSSFKKAKGEQIVIVQNPKADIKPEPESKPTEKQ
ncbi:MAG: lipopolysaccharide transport protein LptA [Polaribacter sp.]|jgi:lipopolysaccharide transport protein LptA